MIRNNIIYDAWQFDFLRGEGSHVRDKSGKKYIDFTSGWNVTNLGWNNLEIISVANEYINNSYAPMRGTEDMQKIYAENLAKSLPGDLNYIGRATGGTEANEEVIKIARLYTKRRKILGCKKTYHGQSISSLSLGYSKDRIKFFAPECHTGDFEQIDFPKILVGQKPEEILSSFEKKLEEILKQEEIAGFVTEAGIVTGWGETAIAPDGYMKIVRNLTKKYGTLMILDEVGTGFSRCGKLWAMELENIVPDIVTLAKGISNGVMPIGAMITTKEIAEIIDSDCLLISTFGWTPLACAVANKTLEIHQRDKIREKSEKDGIYIKNKLQECFENNSLIRDIRGKGMEIGIECNDSIYIQKWIKKCWDLGLHIAETGTNTMQLMPPLTISKEDIDKGLSILIEAFY